MAHSQQQSRVPKFGNWDDTDNLPYTAYFENARREKAAGFMVNPNDPMENPEAFDHMFMSVGENVAHADHQVKASSHHNYSHRQSSVERGHDFADHKRNMSKGVKSRHKSSGRRSSSNDHANYQAIPKFGSWDVKDPKSGEGYTTIFSKKKMQRQIKSSHISSISAPQINNYSNIKNQHAGPSFRLSKYCCCLSTKES
ncbi:RPM1-interacting protein 4-like [Lotus japonicus]|uniref:RPM1-interacting protein 4-like n=1 Tax=Lotus japonicus TaxID=34305 RepID=UPI0025904D49|nr:RPM1-interacting protein 4-like [Lotus japonicus]